MIEIPNLSTSYSNFEDQKGADFANTVLLMFIKRA
jgi:hypothetical protein